MTTKRIVYTIPGAAVDFITPGRNARGVIVADGVGVHDRSGNLIYSAFINGVPRLDSRGIRAETEDEYIERTRAQDVPAGATNVHVCEAAELPYRGGLRAAWTQTSAAPPSVDMGKAQAIKLALLRRMRDERLKQLDGPELRAMAQGDQAELDRVRGVKQVLRDIPLTVQPDLEAITDPRTLDEYEPVWP